MNKKPPRGRAADERKHPLFYKLNQIDRLLDDERARRLASEQLGAAALLLVVDELELLRCTVQALTEQLRAVKGLVVLNRKEGGGDAEGHGG